MANHKKQPAVNPGNGGGATPNQDGGGEPATIDAGSQGGARNAAAGDKPKPVTGPIPEPVPRGRPRKNHGRIADARRDANLRYQARKAGQLPPAGSGAGATVDRGKTSAGYADELVIWHEELAEIMGVPELRLKPARAAKLERAAMEVLSDRGVVVKSPRAHMATLIFTVLLIYVPMVLAIVRKIAADKKQDGGVQMPGPSRPAPKQHNQPAASAAPLVPGLDPGDVKPEQEIQRFDNGNVVHGAFFHTPPGMEM